MHETVNNRRSLYSCLREITPSELEDMRFYSISLYEDACHYNRCLQEGYFSEKRLRTLYRTIMNVRNDYRSTLANPNEV